MFKVRRLASVAVILGLAAVGVAAAPQDAHAWWRGGYGVGVYIPPVVVGPPIVYAPPPVVYARPPVVYAPPPGYYAGPRVWIPPHWQGPYWVPGHWS
jgi:hypothetical protein